jgi:hypothetical protein
LAETINGLYKAEVIHRLGPWKTMASVEWVDWFNNRRLLDPSDTSRQQKQKKGTMHNSMR